MSFNYYDNLISGQRSCYVGDALVWRIPFDQLEYDEEPFGTYAPLHGHDVGFLEEVKDEPPFIETLGYELHGPVEIREVGAEFTDWPANNEDPKVNMRLIEWSNGEGFDVAFTGGIHTDVAMFSMTWTRYEMLNKLVSLLQEE